MSKRTNLVLFAAMFLMTALFSVSARTNGVSVRPTSMVAVGETDRDRDGLIGPVRRIKTETAKLVNKAGKASEGPRLVLETAAYDLKGSKIENAYFPISGAASLTGRESYKYDEKGNISEMTLLNTDGTLLGKEVYSYEYDFVGNWTKMTTSVAVIEGGKLNFEPTEVTYRTISYYLDESLAKMVQPASSTSVPPASQPASSSTTGSAVKPATNNSTENAQPKSEKLAASLPPSGDLSAVSKGAVVGPSMSPAGSNNSASSPGNPVVMSDAPPTNTTPKPLMKPVSGGVLNGKAVDLPSPTYPEVAKRMRATGLVAVEVIIDVNGKVIAAKALNGHVMLQPAAVQAAMRARFSPTTLSGQPVKVSGVINYNFALAK